MSTKVKKWGNSLGITIPKVIADQIKLREGESITFTVKDEQIIISKQTYDLEALCAQITPENRHDEIETDPPVGREQW